MKKSKDAIQPPSGKAVGDHVGNEKKDGIKRIVKVKLLKKPWGTDCTEPRSHDYDKPFSAHKNFLTQGA